jgi:hypothetical protein
MDNNRNMFTKHGLHLNKLGKQSVTCQIVLLFKSIFEQKTLSPIILGWHKYNDDSQKSFQTSCRKETENCKVNIETEKDPEMTDSMNSTSEQKSEILCKSNKT